VHQERRWQRRRFCFATDLTTCRSLAGARSNAPSATREGWRYQHVQAIIVAIDQYAEAATGNRDIFLNRPPGLKRGDVP
jgi:hypothetical protein